MLNYSDEIYLEGMRDGRAEGKEIGREIGREVGREIGRLGASYLIAIRLLKTDFSDSKIAEMVSLPLEEVAEIRKCLEA